MGEPRDYKDKDKLAGAMNEIVSGISALNMPPKPIPIIQVLVETGKGPDDTVYSSESDAWIKHAEGHFRKAFKLLADYETTRRGKYLNLREWTKMLTAFETLFDHCGLYSDEYGTARDLLPEQIRKELEL